MTRSVLDSMVYLSCESTKETMLTWTARLTDVMRWCLVKASEHAAIGRFVRKKAQKFGYRNIALINPEKGLQSSDSVSLH